MKDILKGSEKRKKAFIEIQMMWCFKGSDEEDYLEVILSENDVLYKEFVKLKSKLVFRYNNDYYKDQ